MYINIKNMGKLNKKMKVNNVKFKNNVLRVVFGLFVLFILACFFGLVLFSLYIFRFKDDVVDLNMEAVRLSQTSSIFVKKKDGLFEEYQKLFGSENRIWVDYNKFPDAIKNAIIAIEDKRFYAHRGVDFIRTVGAVLHTVVGKKSFGGSTLTQQLIKNITEDSEFRVNRKIREMARAIRLESQYSKDEILEVYLNIVNFGAGSRGAQAAAKIYFSKNIWDCNIAECCAIAVITQNPTANNPLINPENNRRRRDIAVSEMYKQHKITEEQLEISLKESKNLKFKKYSELENQALGANTQNWYIEAMCNEITRDLMAKYKIKKNMADDILYSGNLKIYCCMDQEAQKIAEETLKNAAVMPKDKLLELGFIMLEFDGRVLAMLGSSQPKSKNFIFDRCNISRRQPGSVIKPLAVYTPALECGMCNFSSIVMDEPLKITNNNINIQDWPANWYKSYKGPVTLQWALEKSANAPAAQILNKLGTRNSFNFLVNKLNLKGLEESDANSLSALATGGVYTGLSVKEMTCAFQIFGNNGQFSRPYTYLYVTDKNDRVILDNRSAPPEQVISAETAGIMNKLLRQIIIGEEGTGKNANIPNWNIIGKTGTTNDDFDAWFIGLSPYCVAGIWIGYDMPKRITETNSAIRIWRHITSEYLKNKKPMDFLLSSNLIELEYCTETGCLASPGCLHKKIGVYSPSFVPEQCTGHG
ncbi:MAG: transglycosylase domain-containing protein [Candidatus Improbicoccus devescovinae]|nr:MAG: transglycosylase domain-containing protein [Candidatus Improbicoccus devescovinae]